MIKAYKLPLLTGAGDDGAAAGTVASRGAITGLIHAIGIDYTGTGVGTADVTISCPTAPALTLLTLTNIAADGWWNIRHLADDNTGADITYDGTNEVYVNPAIHDVVQVVLAQGNSGDTVAVTVLAEV